MCNRRKNDTITITNTILFVKKVKIRITNKIIIYKYIFDYNYDYLIDLVNPFVTRHERETPGDEII